MDSNKLVVSVTLKGPNYILWSRLTKAALGGRGLWKYVEETEAPKVITQDENGKEIVMVDSEKWNQENQFVLSFLQSSLDTPILEAYSYCESANELWDILKKVFGNTSNISRIFEVKREINNLNQEGMTFNQHFGKFRALWAELDILRPSTVDPKVLNERKEQDKVFSLLLTLSPAYNDVIKHILRSDTLPNLEEVCSQIQKEEGSLGLFGGKGEIVQLANKGQYKQGNGGHGYKQGFKKCEHCNKEGHTKEGCWILHPHLRPPRGTGFKNQRANYSTKAQGEPAGTSNSKEEEFKAMATSLMNAQAEMVKRSDLEALIKALKENSGNTLGNSLLALNKTKPLIIDSGASHHMISDSNLLQNMKPAVGKVIVANGYGVPIKGEGILKLFDKESKALYLPSFTSNLLSVKKTANDLQCNVIFSPNDVFFQDIKSSKVFGKGVTKDGMYMLEDTKPKPELSYAFESFSVLDDDVLWHARLGHPHSRALGLILPSISVKNHDCEACILGKHCRTVFPKSSTIYDKCFDLIHSDVWTAPCLSRENHKYFVTFIDEKSKYTWITLLQSKDRVLEAFINFQNHVTNQFNAKIKIFRSDNGGEYTSTSFKQHLSKHGIIHQTSCPYTPQQNGVAERKNRHLMEVARSMMFHSNVPKRFWGDAVMTACYLINRLPTKILQDVSPFEVLNKTKPFINHLRVFGCICFVLVPGEQRNKLEAKSTKAIFVGYSTTQKGYKCYVPETRKVLVSRDVKFVESTGFYDEKNWENLKDLSSSSSDRAHNLQRIMEKLGIGHVELPRKRSESVQNMSKENISVDHERGNDDHQAVIQENQEESEMHIQQDEEGSSIHDQGNTQSNEDQSREMASDVHEAVEEPNVETQEEVQPLRRSTRIRKDPSNWRNTRVYYNCQAVAHPLQATCSLAIYPQEHQAFIANLDEECIPRTYDEAKEHKVWRDAIGNEHEAMETNGTWFESELPKDKKAVSSKWVFTIKYKSDGSIERHKARLVARGFTQVYGEDYIDTFAPVAKLHTIRIVLSLAVNLEWDLWQMDVKNAFLQGELEDEVYMYPPPGLEHIVKPGNVLRLRKAIYGLKQSPRAWYHKLSTTLNGKGFRRSEADHTLFTLPSSNGIVVVLVYVDDIIITGSDKEGVESTKVYLKTIFDIKDLGELKYFLGIEICRSKEGLFLSQRKYTLEMLNEIGTLEGRIAKTPLEDGYKSSREGEIEDVIFEDTKLYRRMVGKLIYLTITRPDICFAVNQASQHMQAPKVAHWKIVERILSYLSGTSDQGVWMGCNKNTEIVGYCDADWAGDRVDRRSTTGYCTFIGGNLVTWKSKKQKVVSCSSAEAEYRAMRKLTNELVWIKNLLEDLGIKTTSPITMHCDNQAAIHIASNSVFHERTKHIEVDCHKVRQMVEQGVILPCYTRSEDQLADIFTKATSKRICESIFPRLGLTTIRT